MKWLSVFGAVALAPTNRNGGSIAPEYSPVCFLFPVDRLCWEVGARNICFWHLALCEHKNSLGFEFILGVHFIKKYLQLIYEGIPYGLQNLQKLVSLVVRIFCKK